MAQVIWTESALTDLREILTYLAERSPEAADDLTARLSAAPDILEHAPKLGRRVPEFNQDHVRELVTVRPYRLIYTIREDSCYVVAIVHGHRDLTRLLHPEDFDEG